MKFIVTVVVVITSLVYSIIGIVLIAKNFVFDGYLKVSYDFSQESPFISLLKPPGRLDQTIYSTQAQTTTTLNNSFVKQDYYQKIMVDPVYFDVSLPRQFSRAKIHVTYKNPIEPLLELGISSGEESAGFYLQPMENKLLDALENNSAWTKIRENDLVLYQKNKRFDSISKFLTNMPSDGKVGVYNYALPLTYKIDPYEKKKSGLSIHKSLRGSHEMYTYVGPGQNFDMHFNFQDVNRGMGEDAIKIELFYYDRPVNIFTISDDGIADDSAFMNKPFDYPVRVTAPPDGLYTIKITCSDDIFIRSITSQEQYLLAFKNHIYLGDNVGYLNENVPSRYEPTVVLTTTEKLGAVTSHKEGFQTIMFGDHKLSVDEKHIIFVQSNVLSERKKWLEKITTEHDDIKVLGKGLFFLSEDTYFDPTYVIINGDPLLDLNYYNIAYIVAHYKPPVTLENGWSVQSLEYDLAAHADGDTTYRFAFSFPYSPVPESEILVSDITIELFTEPIGVQEFFSKSMNKIRQFL